MESEKATKDSSLSCEKSPGSFFVVKSSFLDTNAVKNSKLLMFNTTTTSSSSCCSSSNDGDFLSCDEGFETASENLILADPDEDAVDIHNVCGDSSETYEDVVAENADDVEITKKVIVLDGVKVEQTNFVDDDHKLMKRGLSAENMREDVLEPGSKAVVRKVIESDDSDIQPKETYDVKSSVQSDLIQNRASGIDDDHIVTELYSDEEDRSGKELIDSEALKALLKVATGVRSEGDNITITSQDGPRLFSVERPAGLGSSVQSSRSAVRPNSSNIFRAPSFDGDEECVNNLSDEEKRKLEKLQSLRVRFLRLVKRLGLSVDEPVVDRVLYRLGLVAGRRSGSLFSLDAAKQTVLQLEEDNKEDIDMSLNILVLGKSGVGKSATINAIFGEEKARTDAFQSGTSTVKEITGVVDGVRLRVFDTPGLKCSVAEQSYNCSVLSSVKRLTKNSPIDVVLYVDRLDAHTRDFYDIPLLRTVSSSLESSIWRNAIVTLTHAASAPPDGPSGSPISYDAYIAQRSHVLLQSIGQANGDQHMIRSNSMNPVCLVENHLSCRKNRKGQKVLPNGQIWKPQLMILCYSIKVLTEANSLLKPQEPFDHRRLFGYYSRSHALPYMLSSMLQPRVHQKLLSYKHGGYYGDADIDLEELSDSDKDEHEDNEYEYDQLPPFKPLRKSRLAKLSKEQREAYFEEYDYRAKLLQKKQWKEELKRLKAIKMERKNSTNDYDDDSNEGPVDHASSPLQDPDLPPTFKGDDQAHRYRSLEPTSQLIAFPILDTQSGWDHDFGYEGVNIEQSLALAKKFPAVISLQVTKDKKECIIKLDSSIAAKHGDYGSSIAGFDIQNIGGQRAYIIRTETKLKTFKQNKTAAGISITYLGENIVPGLKIEDQITFGRQYSLGVSAGAVRSQKDTTYGADIVMQRREHDYPIGQIQSSFGLSMIQWRGDLAFGLNSLAQFCIGRNSKVAVRAGINNKLNGQISVRTSSSEYLSLALASIIPAAISIYKRFYPDSD